MEASFKHKNFSLLFHIPLSVGIYFGRLLSFGLVTVVDKRLPIPRIIPPCFLADNPFFYIEIILWPVNSSECLWLELVETPRKLAAHF